MLNLTWIPKCYPCKKKPLKWEFFHAALCSNLECPRSQVKPATPFYCDTCWNKKEFYANCWGCKSPKLKTGTIPGLAD